MLRWLDHSTLSNQLFPRSMKFILPLLLLSLSFYATDLKAQEGKMPIVKGFGEIYEIPGAIMPDNGHDYQIVIDLKTRQRDKESMNPGLNNVARMMNLHGLAGITKDQLKVAVVIHGGTTDAILSNKAYQKRYEVDNPNLELIQSLKQAGAEIYVCGQSLLAREYEQEEVNPQVTIALSMLTTYTDHLYRGYMPLIFD